MQTAARGPQVDQERCTLCGQCVQACPCHLIEWTEEGPRFHCSEQCELGVSCTADDECWLGCEGACPEGAIECPFEIVLGDSDAK